jgi:hypothetical protein
LALRRDNDKSKLQLDLRIVDKAIFQIALASRRQHVGINALSFTMIHAALAAAGFGR